MTPETLLQALPGIGPARAKSLAKLGLVTAEDLLNDYPRGYEDRTCLTDIADAPEGEPVCISALVAEPPRTSRIRAGLSVSKSRIVDGSGSAEVTFFNQEYVRRALEPGESYVFYGKMETVGRKRQLTNPVFERADRTRFTGRIMPVYSLTAGVSNHLLASLALQCVEGCADQMPDELPGELRQRYQLAAVEYALRNVHFPADEEALAVARRRLVFEELFTLSCGMAFLRRRRG